MDAADADLLPGDPALGAPLTARSVIASALLGMEPPELPVAQIVAVCELFGINENRARVALSRMLKAGEVTTVDGRYRLAGRLAARSQRQRLSRRPPAARAWHGTWTMLVLDGDRRDARERAEHRRALGGARLGELREGVWARPDNVDVTVDGDLAARVHRFSARPDDGAALAGRLWDLAAWSRRASALRRRLEATPPAADDLAAGFVLSAAVLRHLQADPLLPDALLPADWAGGQLRSIYDDWDERYRTTLSAWHRRWRAGR